MSEGFYTLMGAAVGALASICGLLISSWLQDRRDRIRLAAEAAWKDYELQMEKGVPSSSAAIFVWYHVRLMQLIERGKLTREALKDVLREKDEFNRAFSEMAVERDHVKSEGRLAG